GAGTLDDLIDAINQLSHEPERKDTQDRLCRLAYDACRHLMVESAGTPIHIRLPNLGSPRAQRMISTWASLAPRLFLPLGQKSLYMPLLRGIADAARDAAHSDVTPLLPAVPSAAELRAFRCAAVEVGLANVGAALQSPAALAEASSLADACAVMWVDIREIIRTF